MTEACVPMTISSGFVGAIAKLWLLLGWCAIVSNGLPPNVSRGRFQHQTIRMKLYKGNATVDMSALAIEAIFNQPLYYRRSNKSYGLEESGGRMPRDLFRISCNGLRLDAGFVFCHDRRSSIESKVFDVFDWPCNYHLSEKRHTFNGIVLLSNLTVAQRRRLRDGSLQACVIEFSDTSRAAGIGNFGGQLVRGKVDLRPTTPSCDAADLVDMTNIDRNGGGVYSREIAERSKAAAKAASSAAKDKEVFLEVKAMEEELIGLEPTVAYVISWISKPVMSTILKMFDTDNMAGLQEDLAHGINEQVPGDSAAMLTETVTSNVTDVVANAVASSVETFMGSNLPRELAAYLGKHVPRAIVPVVHTAVHNVITSVIPHKISRDVPSLVARALYITLAQLLTRVFTHGAVPALSRTLTRDSTQEYWCKECFSKGEHCNNCHDSPQSGYYNSYYSAYYSDYYSKYYADYYTDTLENIDTVQHPASHRSNPAVPTPTSGVGYPTGALKKMARDETEKMGKAGIGALTPQAPGISLSGSGPAV